MISVRSTLWLAVNSRRSLGPLVIKDAGMVTFGMCGGLIHDVPTCQDLVNTIMVDAQEMVTSRLTSML